MTGRDQERVVETVGESRGVMVEAAAPRAAEGRPLFSVPGRTGSLRRPSRRGFERTKLVQPVMVTELDEGGHVGACWGCVTANISRSGLGIRSRRMAYTGRGLLALFPAGPGERPKLLYGVVRHSSYGMGEGYLIGLQFEAPPDTPEVRMWRSTHGVETASGPIG
jgi:hypothetical protein